MRGTAMRWRGLMLCCVGVVGSACVSTPEASPGELFGCYYFERDAVADDLRLPWGVRFLPDSLQGWPAWAEHPGVRDAVTLVNETESRTFPFAYWRPLGSDSLEVGHPGGGVLILRLAVEPGRLEGTVRPVGDVLRPPGDLPAHSPQPVALRSARCPGA